MKRIFNQYPGADDVQPSPDAYWRATLPGRWCAADLAGDDIELVTRHWWKDSELPTFDGYLLHRAPEQLDAGVAVGLRAKGCRFALEWDDDLLHVPPHDPWHGLITRLEPWLLQVIRRADLLIASTPTLAEVMREASGGRPAVVCRNLVDLDQYPQRVPHPGITRVLWHGPMMHGQDVEVLGQAVNRLSAEFGDAVEFVFWGRCPLACLENLQVKVEQRLPLGRYFERLAEIAPDIVVAPLEDTTFNRSKSYLKWLEASAIGAVLLASDVQPYQEIPSGCAVLVPEGGWEAAIREAVVNTEGRRTLTERAQYEVLVNHNWHRAECRRPWLDAYRRLVA